MGYTILAQWTVPQPPANLGNLILIRLLEHYNLTHQVRSSIHFRTFKAAFPTPSGEQTKHLTVISYSQPNTGPTREQVSMVRDDTTYLFLDDPNPPSGSGMTLPSGGSGGESSADPKSNGTIRPAPERQMSLDGFEIIEAPSASSEPVQPAPLPANGDHKGKQKERYKILAVRPSASPLSLLQSLNSPFVMGFTKSAKSAASTTAQTSGLTQTQLPGQNQLLTTFTFPPLAAPAPALVLNIHNLPSPTASTIFLEVEYAGEPGRSMTDEVLKEFVEGCLPGNIPGTVKYHRWRAERDGQSVDSKEEKKGWEGLERTRRATYLLARALREGGMI